VAAGTLAQNPPHHGPPVGPGQDCPGAVTTAEPAAPPIVRFRVPPYGIIWGFDEPDPGTQRITGLRSLADPDYRAKVFHVTDCPENSIGDRFIGLDRLITLMGHEGLKFYRSETVSMESGPDGIIGAADVIVIKINYQWSERGGTNVDVLRGLVRRIVDHPDRFTGEIAICENSQFASLNGFDRAANNAQVTSLSPHDVVVQFQGLGYQISHVSWTDLRYLQVQEYSDGNTGDGYVVYDYDAQLNGRVSYPKFETDYGTPISIRFGIWNAGSGTYDRSGLKFINVPVLKSHHSTYGITACVKNYMGTVTGALNTNSHSAIRYGVLGALLGEIQLADLNILDSIWVNANPYSGPGTSYAGATRRDELVASTDPVAADIWAAWNILIPAFLDNGYTPPWPEPSADPDDPSSDFRQYLDNSMNEILDAGYDVTNDGDRIDAYTWSTRSRRTATRTVSATSAPSGTVAAWTGTTTACPTSASACPTSTATAPWTWTTWSTCSWPGDHARAAPKTSTATAPSASMS
jgi:hypothetical protein